MCFSQALSPDLTGLLGSVNQENSLTPAVHEGAVCFEILVHCFSSNEYIFKASLPPFPISTAALCSDLNFFFLTKAPMDF